jgi:hypothetical protein
MCNFYYSANNELEEKDELQSVCNKLFEKYAKVRDSNNQHLKRLTKLETERVK